MSAELFKVKKKKILESVGSLTYRGIGENDGQFESKRAQFHTYDNIKAQSFPNTLNKQFLADCELSWVDINK